MKVAVITISDRAHKGIYEDKSGLEIEKILKENINDISLERLIIPDDREEILKAFKHFAGFNFIITSGGTGISSRDITPDVTENYCDKAIPGISEALRYESYKETKFAMLSRGFAGLKDKTIIVNFPGSVKAAITCTNTLLPVISHAIKMLNDQGH